MLVIGGSLICALQLGREGSSGFPGKNLFPVLGRPMMLYPLLAAKAAASVERIYLSTDSPRMKALAREYGAEIIDRPAHLATGAALGEDAFMHGYTVIRDALMSEGEHLELLVLLFCNAPTIIADALEDGIAQLRADPSADSAVTVSIYNMWSPIRARRVAGNGYLEPFVPFTALADPAKLSCDRDSQGDVYFADMGTSIVRPRCLEHLHDGLLPQRWMGQRILPIKQWGGLDVDYAWQVPLVEYWLREHGFSESSSPYDKLRVTQRTME